MISTRSFINLYDRIVQEGRKAGDFWPYLPQLKEEFTGPLNAQDGVFFLWVLTTANPPATGGQKKSCEYMRGRLIAELRPQAKKMLSERGINLGWEE